MPHHSRLSGFIIDCRTDDLPAASSFWSQALGLPATGPDDGGLGRYDKLRDGPGGLHIEVQKVQHPSRAHLDIETDDIDAEVARLEALGARRVEFVRDRWRVMRAPDGQHFCVVRMIRDPPEGLNRWD